MVFYDKKNKAPTVQIPITSDGNCLKQVSSKRVLGIIIDEELSFTPHVKNIYNKKSKQAYNQLTCFPEIPPDLVVQIYSQVSQWLYIPNDNTLQKNLFTS